MIDVTTSEERSEPSAPAIRYVAIGDSFTEGIGDERADGSARGWADLVAEGWAASRGASIEYANLAIRGKLVRAIVDEQLEAALALSPTHLSFNGGGNDMLRPRTPIAHITGCFARVIERCEQQGVHLIVLSGADPTAHLPMGPVVRRRGDQLSTHVERLVDGREGITVALNWPDRRFDRSDHWSPDRLHLNARGHHRAAARVLESLGETAPATWWELPDLPVWQTAERPRGREYFREHLGPWIKRRVTRTSSGDGRAPKAATWQRITGDDVLTA